MASDTFQIRSTIIQETQEQVAGFILNRATHLIQQQPELMGFLSGSRAGGLDLGVTRGHTNLDFSSSPDWPLWMSFSGSWSDTGTSEQTYAFGTIGTHRAVSWNLLLGGMLEFDHTKEQNGAGITSGTGWLAGPYLVGTLQTQPVFYEARLLYGQSSNTANPFGTYEDEFDTYRLLASFNMQGRMDLEHFTFIPGVGLSYVSDDQKAYTDQLGNPIPGQKVEMGEFNLSLGFEKAIGGGNRSTLLSGEVSGVWSWNDGTGQVAKLRPAYDGGRARIDFGIDHELGPWSSLSASTFYDGIGAQGYGSYGINISFKSAF
ncbi:hypothetical protein [Sediminimonas qiaohouensis]|uniref:hypothetical protein n=1 Tax=Sediminimonas qiaohouensis TaxID=552061 RepID=UPI00042A8002|nr:hypothetical protein [Sediminimonas qiaohouensis]